MSVRGLAALMLLLAPSLSGAGGAAFSQTQERLYPHAHRKVEKSAHASGKFSTGKRSLGAPSPTAPDSAKPEPAKPEPPAAEPGAARYDRQLLRLAELLGSLTYLRDLCGDGDGQDYRTKMGALLDAEASSGPRRELIAGSFNRGYRAYVALHRTCTPVSRAVIGRSMDEAERVAREIGSRFGAS